MTGSSLSFLGDAVYTLRVREFYLGERYYSPKKLQTLCSRYNSARGQMKAYERMKDFFTEEEMNIFKRGRNSISHIPHNGDRLSYEIASGMEAVCGYLYLTDKERLEEFFREIFKGGLLNE